MRSEPGFIPACFGLLGGFCIGVVALAVVVAGIEKPDIRAAHHPDTPGKWRMGPSWFITRKIRGIEWRTLPEGGLDPIRYEFPEEAYLRVTIDEWKEK